MSFAMDMKRIVQRVREREAALMDACVAEAFQSIVYGSSLTGAPGQPVDENELRPSYRIIRRSKSKARIVSPKPYAEIIENNRRGAQLRSPVGGFHSIKYTRLGWGLIVAHNARRLKTKSPGIRSSTTFQL